MEGEAFLPEEILVLILTLLPVKSLIRFACVSKRFHFIILSDSNFAKSQFKASRVARKLLVLNKASPRQVESLDLDTPAFGDPSSVTKLTFPHGDYCSFSLLGSANGLVFLSYFYYFPFAKNRYYLWNPATGFSRELPDLGLPENVRMLTQYGVGHLQTTDDYKLFISVVSDDKFEVNTAETAVFSTRANAWKSLHTLKSYLKSYRSTFFREGIFLNEALHWLVRHEDGGQRILAFDLDGEEEMFREMSLPIFFDEVVFNLCAYLGVSAGGFLSATFYECTCDTIDVWVMNKYGVDSSWTKLYNSKFPDLPSLDWLYCRVVIFENSMFMENDVDVNHRGITRIDHKEEKHDMYTVVTELHQRISFIQYQESLIRIDD